MFGMAIDYFLLIVAGFFGLLQIVAARNGLFGLRLFSDKKKGYVAGAAITIGAFAWFFSSGNRNIEGHITGVQGAQQFVLFLAGTTVSIFLTAIIVSARHLKSKSNNQNQEPGLEQIRNTTYLKAFVRYFDKKD
jgi:hypothetical protein